MLWRFANGLDTSPVSNIGAKSLIKSIGNSTTTPRDLITDEDIKSYSTYCVKVYPPVCASTISYAVRYK